MSMLYCNDCNYFLICSWAQFPQSCNWLETRPSVCVLPNELAYSWKLFHIGAVNQWYKNPLSMQEILALVPHISHWKSQIKWNISTRNPGDFLLVRVDNSDLAIPMFWLGINQFINKKQINHKDSLTMRMKSNV